jgi:hypothetical protein
MKSDLVESGAIQALALASHGLLSHQVACRIPFTGANERQGNPVKFHRNVMQQGKIVTSQHEIRNTTEYSESWSQKILLKIPSLSQDIGGTVSVTVGTILATWYNES